MKKVLLVDDDEIVLIVLKKVLEKNNYLVTIGRDGKQGLAAIEKESFDLIVSDIMMPYLNGFEFIEALKTHENTKKTKVIIISSITHEESISSMKELGADHYLPKPIEIEKFMQLVSTALQ